MFFRDLAYASRTLRNSPIFTLTAVVTLALGVGASTAIFSVTNAVLLRQLPYLDADRLVVASGELAHATSKIGRFQTPISSTCAMAQRERLKVSPRCLPLAR
jgi:hypothetical protein